MINSYLNVMANIPCCYLKVRIKQNNLVIKHHSYCYDFIWLIKYDIQAWLIKYDI